MNGIPFYAERPGPYAARPASGRDQNYPLWLVHGADGVNCLRWHGDPSVLFVPRHIAEGCAAILNEAERGLE